ncbi:MAG: enoyl-CoA hydratase [Frankiales bacterium]|nr:enoyl-CoA hydratase [Frankiales bacterium]
MSTAAVSLEVDADGIATVFLDRPDKLNAFTAKMMDELLEVFDRTDADDAVRAVVVTGRGRAFCAGADLSSGAGTFDYENQSEAMALHENGVHRDGGGLVTLRIFDSLKPVIGAINGPAVGVGASMTLAMDARLAVPGAQIGFVFARRGLPPDAAASWFLPRLVGIPQALEWCFSGRVFLSDEAHEKGLVQQLHGPEQLLAAAKALARAMTADASPVAVALTRQLVWRMAGAPHPMLAHRADSRGLQAQGARPDVAEGVTAFLEKRPARFPGRVSSDLPDMWDWWSPPGFA